MGRQEVKDLCFLSAVNEGYEQFVPIFLYSINEAYPEAGARIFLETSGEGVKPALELFDNENFKVIPNAFEGYAGHGRSPAMWRYLTLAPPFYGDLEGYKYYYITDCDFIICREEPTLKEQHLAHCEVLGLNYSGHVRHYLPKLVCGRFFFKHELFAKVERVADMYNVLVRDEGEDVFRNNPRHPDEHLLHCMIVESGNAELPILEEGSALTDAELLDPSRCNELLFNPHHGVHLGIGRGKLARIQRKYGELLRTSYYAEYLEHLFVLYADPIFREVLTLTPGSELLQQTILRMLEVA